MNPENKRNLSISMLRANLIAVFIMVPVAILQFSLYQLLYVAKKTEFSLHLLNILLFLALLIASIVVHELIHGLTWMGFGKKPFSALKFDI